MIGCVGDEDRLFKFFTRQRGDRAAIAERGNKCVGTGGIQDLDDLTLHVDFTDVSEHAGQRGAASQTANSFGPGSDCADHGEEAVRNQLRRRRLGDDICQRLQ